MDLLIFPNQLFANHPGLESRTPPSRVLLIEDSLFFGDARYPLHFHQHKLWLHRATLKRYEQTLRSKGLETVYLEYKPQRTSLHERLVEFYASEKNPPAKWIVVRPTDFILEKRLDRARQLLQVELEYLPDPGFLNSPEQNSSYRATKDRWFMADFYKWQRRRLNVLMENDQPVGGKWSFDSENRKKIPRNQLAEIPSPPAFQSDAIDQQAQAYVAERFPHHPGNLHRLYYPTSHQAAERWLQDFLRLRLQRFGDYEDAIVAGESWLWHSVLTPMLNIGLLTPDQVLNATLDFANTCPIPVNSLEGFIRQLIGWREFMRATYEDLSVVMRTTNYWNHQRSLPQCFYDGTTEILPIDDTIRRVIATGYCHHIERLMVLGGFMFLCEFHPDEIYRWFMEMFVDSYDWVMVPNVYSMSQHADGGLITTKPYFSGSSYIKKMSHYRQAHGVKYGMDCIGDGSGSMWINCRTTRDGQ